MKKRYYFASRDGQGWPSLDYLRPFFLSPPGKRWFFETRNDGAIFQAFGVDGTEHLPEGKGRIDLSLSLWGDPHHGVFLLYRKYGGGLRLTYSSKGDLSRLGEYVRTLHDDPMPVGLYIPYGKAWLAVKEFIETDGALPTSIEWIANRDLPPNTFPDP